MPHYLYLVRHGEQQDAEHGLPDGPLSPRGKRQAQLIAERLGGIPFTVDVPLAAEPRGRDRRDHGRADAGADAGAVEPAVRLHPVRARRPDMPKAFESFFGAVTDAEIEAGRAQMDDAVNEFLTPARGDRHDLLITHNFVIGWFVRHVFDAPDWRWLGLNQANCGLTIIRVRSAKPPVLVVHNDLGHLPVELRTGLPELQPV